MMETVLCEDPRGLWVVMEALLKNLFDFQRFEEEPGLAEIIQDTMERYGTEDHVLSDEDLALVNAAGEAVMREDWLTRRTPGGVDGF